MASGSFDYIFKVIIIGDSGVGKSCILQQFIGQDFDPNKENTVGVEFGNKVVELPVEPRNPNSVLRRVKLQIWDTAGQEQFKSITRSYYRCVAGALVVYDVTNRESFDNVRTWVQEARTHANAELVIVLCGNKIDKLDRKVTVEEGRQFAADHGLLFAESSAKENKNIVQLFTSIGIDVLQKVQGGQIDTDNEEFGVRRMAPGNPRNEGAKLNEIGAKDPKSGKKKCC